MEAIEEPVTLSNKDQTQIIIKGKRTKRQRQPSPLRLPATSSRTSTDNNSGGFDVPTASSTTSAELRDSTEEEEDMANCLILLAQGCTRKPVASPENNNKSGTSRLIYECKTCNRCFPSFQALGGHRASHKKPRTNEEENKKQAISYLNEENDHSHHDSTTSTDLSLQITNRSALLNANTNTKSKVHECAICGAEFSSGQALGGHMRRHRTITASASGAGNGIAESQEVKKPRNVLKLDLNLPALEDDHNRETEFPFHQSEEKVIVFSATSLVDCHY